MYLKNIEISGFKSFAKKSSLTFNTSISAIVGPNGSGKSNVAEAFRFVLGEQSIKSLRGKKGEDLIFHGTADGARSNRASVKVSFDNSNKFLSIDFPEVTIERIVHRDGVNEYLINGTQVRLKDVVELLSSAHIGASGHHIISQGEADRILSSNAKERRVMIEDALGLKIYQYKREESERKLEKTLENMNAVEGLRKEIAPHIRFLKKQVEKIEKAAELKQQFIESVKEYLKRENILISESKKDIAKELEPLQVKKTELEKEHSDARLVLESAQTKDQKREDLIVLERTLSEIRHKKDSLLQLMGTLEGQIASEERIVKKQQEIARSNTGSMVPLSEVEKLSENIHAHIFDIEKTDSFDTVKSLLLKIRELFDRFIDAKKTSNQTSLVEESEQIIQELRGKKDGCEQDLREVRQKEEKLDTEYRNLQTSIEKEKDSNRDAEKALFRIMADQNALEGELAKLLGKQEGIAIREENFKREREECALLAGRGVLDYEAVQIERDEVMNESHEIQDERLRGVQKMKVRLEDSGLSGSDDVMKEYQDASERDAFLERELGDLASSASSLRELIAELGEKLDTEFTIGIDKINQQFNEFFSLMFGGGSAALSVTKTVKGKQKDTEFSEDQEGEISEEESSEEGIDIDVSLPRKKIKGLMMLSGGERALTSIALLFAMSQVKPPPFIILDETDAALDEANSKKYGDMIESLAKYSQLILITHNRETMARAGTIYGVTMAQGGISKVLSIQFEEAVIVAK